MFVRLLVSTCIALALACAQPAPERLTSVEGITEYRLSNGLHVLLFPDPSKSTATVNITYLVGSRHENYGETGMAHLLEHMLFKGTARHPNIPQELTEHGARPNGTTWFDRTNYFETFQATPQNLNWALDLEADRMVNSFVAKKDLDSEMTVVRNEFEMGENSPLEVLMDRVVATAYLWHNYGKSTIGARSDIEQVPIERLQAFYRAHYQPDNAILTVAGKIDEAETLELVRKYFGPIPRPTRKLQTTYTAEPTQDGERAVTLRRVGDVQELCVAYHVPAGSHADFAAVHVLSLILRDSPSGRLYKALVETKKASSVSGYDFQFRDPGVILLFAQVRKESSLDEARAAMLKTVDGVISEPVTKEEVERARGKLVKQVELDLNNSERIGLQLSEWAGMGDWRLMFLHRDRLRKVTPDDVQRVAKTYLKESNRTIGAFIPTAQPERAEIPPPPDVISLVKDYKGEAAVAMGEAFDASPANIDARTIRSEVAPGLKLALVPKKTRGNTVSAMVNLRFGDEKSLFGQSTVAAMTANMLLRGSARHTRQQLQDEFDRLKARVLVTGNATSTTATIETVRANLPDVLRLIGEVLREPVFPSAEFDQLKQQRLAAAEQQRSEPQSMAMVAFQRYINPYPKGDPRYNNSPDEDIAALQEATIERVKAFYRDFYGASHAELAIVGDVDAESAPKLASALFGGWNSAKPFAEVKRAYRHLEPQNKTFEAPDKANAWLVAGLPLDVSDEHADYPALVFGNYMLGGGFLNSRLATRIRQKEGLSYGVGSMLMTVPKENRAQFMTYAICAPQNVPKVEKAFREELERALKDGFTAQEIAAAKSGWLQAQQVSRSQDPELMRKLASERFYGRTMAWDADLEKRVSALTADDIVSAMRRHLKPELVTVMKAGDFKKAGVTP